MNFLIEAIQSLRPGAEWSLDDRKYSGLNWFETNTQTKPTEEEVEAEVARLQSEYESKEYQRQRAVEYPPISDYIDACYWASKGDTTKLDEYYSKCDAVKLKYPKIL